MIQKVRPIDMLTKRLPRKNLWRVWLAVVVSLGLALGPIAMTSIAHAQEGHGHSTMGHNDNSDHSHADDRSAGAMDLKTPHCCSFSTCSPTFLGASNSGASALMMPVSAKIMVRNDSLLRTQYLDGDPPVPRIGFSKI